jgi:hypothetical protein
MFDDIGFLVNQTFAHSKSAIDAAVSSLLAPAHAGLIYKVQISGSTFVVRTIACKDMSESFELLKGDTEQQSKLRVDKKDFSEVKFFECESFDHAKIIKKQIANRRFPIFEEHVCNVSDPGFSWWLKDEGASFGILFNLSHTDQMGGMTKLGPLADNSLAHKKFQKFYGFFNTLFPVKTFSSGRSRFSISIDPAQKGYFDHLKQALIHGEFSLSLLSYIEDVAATLSTDQKSEYQSAYYFLKELVVVRKFWLEVQSSLNS